jgi:hypothetical protein
MDVTFVARDFVGEWRSRTDQAHLPAQHMGELRQLIDREASE